MNSTLRARLLKQLAEKPRGFTLIELLVVIVIVGVLSAVAVPTFLNQVQRSRVAEAQAGLSAIGAGAEVYRFDNGIYPPTVADANANVDRPFDDVAENYTLTIEATDATGVHFRARGSAGAYDGLECNLGLGDDQGLTDLDSGCTTFTP